MIQDYLPVLFQMIVAIGFAVFTLVLSVLIGKRGKRTVAKDAPYECGKDPIGSSNPRFSVKFYLIAMLFILFDIETVFMYAWSVVYREQLQYGLTIFISMFSFVGVLMVGYLYALRKGAFEWAK